VTGPAAPLPIRPRPASGESTASYIRRLAVANHLRPAHLRRYLEDPGSSGGIRLSLLAILTGRPAESLQHALADQQPHGGVPARSRPPGARRRKQPGHRPPAPGASRAGPPCCSFCGKDNDPPARLVSGPGVCICSECVGLCTQILAGETAPETAAWRKRPDDELLASLPRMQAAAPQIEAAMHDYIDTLRTRGVSWARIGKALGFSRQAAWARFSGEDRP
jgi:ClpX C4-type zinc finger/TniQ